MAKDLFSEIRKIFSGLIGSIAHFCMIMVSVHWYFGVGGDPFLGILATVYTSLNIVIGILYAFTARRVILKRNRLVREIRHGRESRNKHQTD